jgi:hypothetical protein
MFVDASHWGEIVFTEGRPTFSPRKVLKEIGQNTSCQE